MDPHLTPGTVTTKSKFHVTLGHQTARRPGGEALAFWVIKPVVKNGEDMRYSEMLRKNTVLTRFQPKQEVFLRDFFEWDTVGMPGCNGI